MRTIALAVLLLSAAVAQVGPGPQHRSDAAPPLRLPNGSSQLEEILKSDHQKNVREIGELIRIAEEVQDDLLKQDRHVLALNNLKKLEQIEKMAKALRSRIRK